MKHSFNRIITLLRKEKGITQKEAAAKLGISQALLSHYEKGIRECGLEFLVKLADYYSVSCDYLLGRSADRSGLMLNASELPDAENSKDGVYKGSVLPTLNKKLISNSLNVLYGKLDANPDKGLVSEISAYLMLAVYKMFRTLYSANAKNAESMFVISKNSYVGYSDAAMNVAEMNANALVNGEGVGEYAGVKDVSEFSMTTESITKEYPLYSTSLFNLIKTSEERIEKQR